VGGLRRPGGASIKNSQNRELPGSMLGEITERMLH
jgi:hypothetical protein